MGKFPCSWHYPFAVGLLHSCTIAEVCQTSTGLPAQTSLHAKGKREDSTVDLCCKKTQCFGDRRVGGFNDQN